MAAGDSARRAAWANEKEALRLLALSRRQLVGAEGEGLVVAALRPLTELGWTLLEDRRRFGGSDANIDVIAVGPGGIVVVDAKNWHSAPRVVNDIVLRGHTDCSAEVSALLSTVRRVEERVATLGIAPAAVIPMLVFVGHQIRATSGRVVLRGANAAVAAMAGLPIRLAPAMIRSVSNHLELAFPSYTEPPEGLPPAGAEALTLADIHEMLAERERSARSGPIEEWMTWISPGQVEVVRRVFGGPARIRGAAGTGKSVVGLHRAAHLAGRGEGRVLFVTFVRNLVNMQRTLLRRAAPSVSGRVDFRTVHSLAKSILARHGPVEDVDEIGLDRCFTDAWRTVGRAALSHLDRRPGYWKDEIHYVIKGRGFATLADYLGPERHGRITPLQDRHREAVWQLYTEYERMRRERGLYDFADMLLMALDSIRQHPYEHKYSSVVVDEAQDLSLTGLRLVHALIGDRPDGLLLIGDARQAVYPGGYRLADAGLQIRGARSVVFRVNYRNRPRILALAAELAPGRHVIDIDGEAIGDIAVETTRDEGEITQLTVSSDEEIDRALVAAVKALGEPEAAAVLCPDNASVGHYTAVLRHAGLPTVNLEYYHGAPTPAIKIGTFTRSKGIEFKHVFLPDFDRAQRRATNGGLADPDRAAQAHNELYVAMVRARDTLWLATIRSHTT